MDSSTISAKAPSDKILKEALLALQEPVVLHKMLGYTDSYSIWDICAFDWMTFARIFHDQKLPFRVGYNAKSTSPQWEIECSTEFMTLSDFIKSKTDSIDSEKWYYFDYKYMHEWLRDRPEILESISWKRFGFDKDGSDSTIWIGSKGAHTNCHQDSYGCNLIAQIYGSKQWLLFPPSCTEGLKPTRIPYEESTVYSRFNFFAPTVQDQEDLLRLPDKARLITLNQGDVLFVPNGWWHYVESLSLSLSVNVWLPIDTDSQSRVQESLVKLIVSTLGEKHHLTAEDHQPTQTYCMSLVQAALTECTITSNETPLPEGRNSSWTPAQLSAQYPEYVKPLPELDKTELQLFLAEKGERFRTNIKLPSTANSTHQNSDADLTLTVIKAFTHPDIVKRVAELILKESV